MGYLKVLDYSKTGHFHNTYILRRVKDNTAIFYGERVEVRAIDELKEGKQVYVVLKFAL